MRSNREISPKSTKQLATNELRLLGLIHVLFASILQSNSSLFQKPHHSGHQLPTHQLNDAGAPDASLRSWPIRTETPTSPQHPHQTRKMGASFRRSAHPKRLVPTDQRPRRRTPIASRPTPSSSAELGSGITLTKPTPHWVVSAPEIPAPSQSMRVTVSDELPK